MIAYIEGLVIYSKENELIIKTNSGVGYKITSSKMAIEQSQISLYVYHIIRETSQDLFGFASLPERYIFEKLLSVKGVGPKSAFALMNSLGSEKIINSIKFEDTKTLSSAPGIGKKAAAQIILDLSSKIDDLAYSQKLLLTSNNNSTSDDTNNDNKFTGIADNDLEACIELGFSKDDVWPSILLINKENDHLNESQMLSKVLKSMNNRLS